MCFNVANPVAETQHSEKTKIVQVIQNQFQTIVLSRHTQKYMNESIQS